MAKRDDLQTLMRDLESHTEVRRFGSGWLSGFFGLLFAITGFFLVVALRFPDWFAPPQLAIVTNWTGFRGFVHLTLRSEELLEGTECVRTGKSRWKAEYT